VKTRSVKIWLLAKEEGQGRLAKKEEVEEGKGRSWTIMKAKWEIK